MNVNDLEQTFLRVLKPTSKVLAPAMEQISLLEEHFGRFFEPEERHATRRDQIKLFILDALGFELDKHLKYRRTDADMEATYFTHLDIEVVKDRRSPYWLLGDETRICNGDDYIAAVEWFFKTYIKPIWKILLPSIKRYGWFVHQLRFVEDVVVLERYTDFRIAYFNHFVAGKLNGTPTPTRLPRS